jgi:hypothetical protein
MHGAALAAVGHGLSVRPGKKSSSLMKSEEKNGYLASYL